MRPVIIERICLEHRRIQVILLSLFVLVSVAVAAGENPPQGEIRVVVQDETGKGIQASGRLIRLSVGGAAGATPFETDAQGLTTLTGLAPGQYRLMIERSGFVPVDLRLDLAAGAAPLTRKVTLTVAGLAFSVDVVDSTPLPGTLLPVREIPAPVQTGTSQDLAASGSIALSDFLQQRLSGVHLNEIQGNPFQPDLNYRGYTASPLLGTPQGISIYLDGVRMNQPFGDVVSWDLLPRAAIAELTLMPGSNPIFGLNTLGAAISIQTKEGWTHPGSSFQIGGGSFGRATADLEHGGATSHGLAWYLASTLFFEKGWRTDSPSNVRQFFGKSSWERKGTILGLTAAFANNRLTGNGLQEQRLLAGNYRSVYTKPDITANRAPWLNLTLRRAIGRQLTLSANVYGRQIRTRTFNGDINEESLTEDVYRLDPEERAALAQAGYRNVPTGPLTPANSPFPFWRCIAQVLLRDEPAEKCNGLINRTGSWQSNAGGAVQLGWSGTLGGQRHQVTGGLAYDRNWIRFHQSSQLGYLNPDRGITPLDAFGDGVSGGSADDEPYDTRVDLHGRVWTGSFYLTDTWAIARRTSLTLSGRYNRTTIDNRDRILPLEGPGSLTGRHTFARFNPAIGLTYWHNSWLNPYAAYTEGSRAPTSIELGCADPNFPCRLPNALAGDPPLDQVVTRTVETGLRGELEGRLRWDLGWFHTVNHQDLLFVASGQTGFGYFRNFGRTRREGMKGSFQGRFRRLGVGANYTLLNAIFDSPERVGGTGNSTNDGAIPGLEGAIEIDPGAQIPLIPRHLLNAFADLQATSRLTLHAGLVGTSQAFARGNENNRHQPDGRYYLGQGVSPRYTVVSAGGRYRLLRGVELFVQIQNLFNRRYSTAAQLGHTGFDASGNFVARPFGEIGGEYPVTGSTFLAPGAPRGIWSGLRLSF